MASPKKTYNLYDLRPQRAVAWEEGENGRVIILVPKFRNRFLVQWLLPLLRSQYFRVKLDDLGSAIWRQCDGTTTVAAMGDSLLRQFGEQAEPVYERIGTFIRRLEKGSLLDIPRPDRASERTFTEQSPGQPHT